MPNADVVWVDVLPSLKQFGSQLQKGVGTATSAVGQQAGRDFGSSFGQAAQSSVEAASAKMKAALDKTADAAGKVRVAEERLQELRAATNTKASALAAAEERLASARRGETAANSALADASRRVKDAQDAHTDATTRSSIALADNEKKAGLVTRTFGGMHSAVALGFGAFAAASGATAFIGGALNAARDLGETVNKSNVIFGANAGAIDTWAKGAARSVGLSRQAALDAAAGFGNMFTQLGFTGDEAAKLSTNVVQMSADLGSFNNLPTGDVAERISAAFRGEYDSLQLLIPNINAARVEQEAMAATGKTNADSLTAQEKAAAVLAIVQKDGSAAMGDFARTSDGLANSQKILQAEWQNSKARLGELLLGPMTAIVHWTSDTLLPVVGGAWTEITGSFTAFANAWKYNDGDITSSGMPGLFERLGYWAHQAWDVLNGSLIPAVKATAGFFADNQVALVALIGAFVAWRVATAAGAAVLAVQAAGGLALWITQTGVATAASTAWTGAQWLLNAAISAFPVILIIAALAAVGVGLYELYKRSETFRDIVNGVWSAVQAGAQFMWNNVLRPVFTSIDDGWRALVTGVQWAWNNILHPVWTVIQTAADVLYQILAVTIFVAIYAAWKLMSANIEGVWKYLLKPVWDAVSAAASWLWSNVLSPTFGWISDRWEWMAGGIAAVWRTVISPAWDALKTGLQWVGDKFDAVVGWIGRIWDTLRGKLAKPINFLINTVWNGGIRKAWNLVADLLPGVDPIGELKPIAEYAQGGSVRRDYTVGGGVRGPGTGTSDSIPAWLSNGEHVLTAAEVAAAGGHQAIYAWRKALTETDAGLAFAGGGPVWQGLWNIVHAQFPTSRLTSSVRPGDPGMHGKGKAIDVAGPRPGDAAFMLGINRWIASNYGKNSRALIHTPGINLLNGAPHTFDAATRAAHYDHVHWDANEVPGGGGGVLGFLGDAVGGVVDWLGDMLGKVGSLFTTPARALVNAIPYNAPPQFLGIPKALGNLIIDKAEAFFKSSAEDTSGSMDAGPSASVSVAASGGVQEQVRAIASTFGWGTGIQWDALVKLVQGESGWNPNAANPTSSARGLFQKMTSINGPIEPTPAGQAKWGLAYIKNRYGTPLNAYNTWLSRSPHWYHSGGAVQQAIPTFHSGGTTARWSGDNLALLAPDERVLMPEQDDFFRRFVAVAEAGVAAGAQLHSVTVRIGDEEFQGYIDARIDARDADDALDVRSSRL